MSEFFPKPRPLGGEGGGMKVELVWFNYAKKADLNSATCFDTSRFTNKVDLLGLKSENDKLDIGKLETIPVILTKLIDLV